MSVKLESIAQLAKRIEKSERQVRGWIENSLIRYNRLRGKIEIPEGAYEEMLAATEVKAAIENKKLPKLKSKKSVGRLSQRTFLDPEILDQVASKF